MKSTLKDENIKLFAPIVKIHSKEEYFPVDPKEFKENARFRHHKTHAYDTGYNKKKKKWETSDSKSLEYYNIPWEVINSYGLYSNGKNCRPRDKNRGPNTYYLETKGNMKGNAACILNNQIPAFYRILETFPCPGPDDIKGMSKGNMSKYYSIIKRMFGITDFSNPGVEVNWLKFYFFYGFSDNIWKFNHQGDWEHISLVIVDGKLNSVFIKRHGTGIMVNSSELKWEDGHFVIYSAKGTHGNYPYSGKHKIDVKKTDFWKIRDIRDIINYGKGLKDVYDDCNDGYKWETYKNLLEVNKQPWKNYAGAWGGAGLISETTGPSGPWYKGM
jgi:hypothetical protein